MSKIPFYLLFLGLLACSGKKSEVAVENSAQEFMHRKSPEELINQFNDSSRNIWQKPEEVLDFMKIKPSDKVADIGAGSGYFTFLLANKAQKVIAIDIEEAFILHLNAQILRLNTNKVETRQATATSPKLNKNEVDKALMVNTIHHIDKKAKYLSKIRSGLKVGGSLYIIDFKTGDFEVGPPNEMKISIKELSRELALAGFHQVAVDSNLLEYQYIIKAN